MEFVDLFVFSLFSSSFHFLDRSFGSSSFGSFWILYHFRHTFILELTDPVDDRFKASHGWFCIIFLFFSFVHLSRLMAVG